MNANTKYFDYGRNNNDNDNNERFYYDGDYGSNVNIDCCHTKIEQTRKLYR